MIGEQSLRGESCLPTGKFFRRNNLWLFLPVASVLLSWLFSTGQFSVLALDILKGFKLLVFLFAPGCYLAVVLGKIMQFRLGEVLTLDLMISGAMAMFVSIYLSFPFPQITEAEIFCSLFLLTMLCGLALLPWLLKPGKLEEKTTLSNVLREMIGLSASFLIVFLLVMRVVPASYWGGWDPWVNTAVTRTILEDGLNPFELSSRYAGVANIGVSGFFYFLAAVQAATSIDSYLITRFGGPVLAGTASMITYLLVRRLEGKWYGLSACFFLFLNPFIAKRFSMSLRENFGYIFLFALLLLLVKREKDVYKGKKPTHIFLISIPIGLFLATTLVSHTFVAIVSYFIVVSQLIVFLFKDKHIPAFELTLSFFLSLLAIPYLQIVMPTFTYSINKWSSNANLSPLFIVLALSITMAIVLICIRRLRSPNFSDNFVKATLLLLIYVLLFGAFYSVAFPKEFHFLGWNPPIDLTMFSVLNLVLAFLWFLNPHKSPIPGSLLSLGFLLILVLNLPNLNIAFPLFRLVVYICWFFSYLASCSLRWIHSLSSNFYSLFKPFKIRKRFAALLFAVLLFTPLVLVDLKANQAIGSNYIGEDVESAIDFLSILERTDVVVPQGRTQALLLYVGIDSSQLISNKSALVKIYSSNDPLELSQAILSENQNATKAYVFVLRRFKGNSLCPYPSEQLLSSIGRKSELGSAMVYEIPLFYRILELLEYPTEVNFPGGKSQKVKLNLTERDLSKSWGSLTIQMNVTVTERKAFYIKFYDTLGNASERIVFTLDEGEKTYYIPIEDLKETVDLSNLSVMEFNFSNWSPSKIELTILSIRVVIKDE